MILFNYFVNHVIHKGKRNAALGHFWYRSPTLRAPLVRAFRYIALCALAFCALPAPAQPKILLGSDLFKRSSFGMIDISPSGNWISAYSSSENGNRFLLISKDKGTVVSVLGTDSNAVVTSYVWVNENHIYLTYNDPTPGRGFLVLDYSEENPRAKFHDVESKGHLLAPLVGETNQVLFARSSDSSGHGHRVYNTSIDNLIKGNFRREDAFQNPLKDAQVYYSPGDKTLFAISHDDVKGQSVVWFLPGADKKWQLLYTYADDDSIFMPVGFIGDGTLAVLTNQGSDLVSLFEFDIAEQKLTKLLYQHPRYDLVDAIYSLEDRKVEAVRFLDHGRLTTEYFTKENIRRAEILALALPGKQVMVVAESKQANTQLIAAFSSSHPTNYYLLDLDAKLLTPISAENPALDSYHFAESQIIDVHVDEDRRVEAFLTMPDQERSNNVLLVMPHGGPIGVRETDFFNKEVQFLVSRGYSVLRVNFSGSSGYGKQFMASGVGQFGQAIENDIAAVVDHVSATHVFSATCSIGASYGGYSAIMLAISEPERYQCVIAMYGVFDLPLLFNQSNVKTQQIYRDRAARAVGEMDDSLSQVSPVYFAEKIQQPVLLIAGRDDKVAGFEQSNRMRYALRKQGKQVESLFYNGVGHGHSLWQGDRHQYAFIDRFLRRQLNLAALEGAAYEKANIEEEVLLAEWFQRSEILEPNPKAALKYYRLAAERGHASSMFKVGGYYHRGEVVEKNLETAMQWYKRASAAGSGDASYHLGGIYYEGKGERVPKALDKSFTYFNTAFDQGYDAESALYTARALCLGYGVEMDVPMCLERLDLSNIKQQKNSVTDETRKIRGSVLVKVYSSGKFKPNELTQLQEIVRTAYKNARPIEFSFKLKSQGLYRYNSHNVIHHKKTTDLISVGKKSLIGVKFQTRARDRNMKDAHTAIFVKWTRQKLDSGDTELLWSMVLYGNASGIWSNYYVVQPKESAGYRWRLELYDLQQNMIFAKSFRSDDGGG